MAWYDAPHEFLKFALVAVASSILLSFESAIRARTASGQPNIVLILADDLGINDLACYGRSDHHTPNLDRLASQGMRFTCAYTAQPICSPSRAAIMTGKCPARLNLTNYLPGRPDAPSQRLLQPRIEGQLPIEEVTLAELLKNAGYATGLFGKWHLGESRFGPAEQGFDVVVSPPANTEPTRETGGKGEFLDHRRGGKIYRRAPRPAVLLLRAAQQSAHPARCGRRNWSRSTAMRSTRCMPR